MISLALAHWVNPNWLWFTLFVGANLFQSSLTRWCLMEDILIKLGVGGRSPRGSRRIVDLLTKGNCMFPGINRDADSI